MSLSPSPGTVLAGRYRLESELGAGAFGHVFRAVRVADGLGVALKVLPHGGLDRIGGVARARREAELGARLNHPNCVRVLDAGDDPAGWFYIALELLEGRTVEVELERLGPMSPRQAAIVVLDVLSGLEAAHAIGIVHRDLKPANLFLVPGPHGSRVKVLDFGLAKSVNAGTMVGLTQAGMAIGTPLYMAPEQIQGGDITPASDLFSLGLLLVELVAPGEMFDGAQAMGILVSRISGVNHPPPASIAATGLLPIVSRAIELDPRRRFGSAAEMRAAILEVLPTLSDVGQRGPSRFLIESSSTALVASPAAQSIAKGAGLSATFAAPAARPVAAPAPTAVTIATAVPAARRRSTSRIAGIVIGATVLAGAIGASVYLGYTSASGAKAPAKRPATTSTAAVSHSAARAAPSTPPAVPADTVDAMLAYMTDAARLMRSHTPDGPIYEITMTVTLIQYTTDEGDHQVAHLLSPSGEVIACEPMVKSEGRKPIRLDEIPFASLPAILDDAREHARRERPDVVPGADVAVQIYGEWIAEGEPPIRVTIAGEPFFYDAQARLVRRVRRD